MPKCYFCDKNINFTIIYDIRYFYRSYCHKNLYEYNKNIILWIPDLNKKCCYGCGISYMKNKYLKNRTKNILNRQTYGKIFYPKQSNFYFLDVNEYCSICSEKIDSNININTPIACREFYVDGIGELCMKCYNLFAL